MFEPSQLGGNFTNLVLTQIQIFKGIHIAQGFREFFDIVIGKKKFFYIFAKTDFLWKSLRLKKITEMLLLDKSIYKISGSKKSWFGIFSI